MFVGKNGRERGRRVSSSCSRGPQSMAQPEEKRRRLKTSSKSSKTRQILLDPKAAPGLMKDQESV